MLTGIGSALTALLVFAWLAQDVLRGRAHTFDDQVRMFVYGHSSPALTSAMRFVTDFGSVAFLITLGLVLAAILVRSGWPRAAALLWITLGGALALNLVLKSTFERARPAPFFGTVLPDSYSFPSGHALFSVCFYGVLAALASTRTQRALIRYAVWVSAVLLVGLIGLSRIYLGVHYPSDVLAGYAAGILWVLAVAAADRRFRQRRSTTDAQSSVNRPPESLSA